MALAVHAAAAQTTIAPSRFEVMAGVNFAKFDAADAGTRAGLVAGVGIVKPLAPTWSLQPELTYSMKGAKGSGDGATITLKLSYLELPLLVRYDLPTQSGVHPFLLAGPALALKLTCDIEGTDGTITVSGSCGNVSGDVESEDAKTFDFGAMFGGGLAFKHLDHLFTLGLRYNLGLVDVTDNGGVKNRVLSIVGGFEWP
ncbi:MAG: PorT family protein [Acidobacteria bacterium]|nr:PorT family protein [Acidobacteriota bacterium]